MPVFLSDVPAAVRSGALPLDAVFVNATPPDAHGFCSLGTSVEAMHAAIRAARTVIVQFNRRCRGRSATASSTSAEIDLGRRGATSPPYEHAVGPIGDVERRIGEHVAELVPDGATLQLGIGAIPAATALLLRDKHDLGVHTEMFTDAVVDLVEAGRRHRRAQGAQPGQDRDRVHDGHAGACTTFVNDNPMVEMRPVDFTNDTHVIRSFSRMIAINSAIEVDLTGQVVADSIGHRLYSGVGGQMDFIRGAALAAEGRAIIALPSTAADGPSRGSRPTLARGRRRRHDPRPRADGRHRVGRRRAVRPEPPRAGRGAHRRSPTPTIATGSATRPASCTSPEQRRAVRHQRP